MNRVLKLIKGTFISIIIFVAMSLLAGLLLTVTGMPERYTGFYLIVALSASCAFAGLYAGNLSGKKGLFSGVIFSGIALAIILTATALSFSTFISADVLSFQYIIPLSFGGIFGIIGTNLKN